MSSLRKPLRVIAAENTSDGAGVRLKRSIGLPDVDYIDPFLLLDEFSSDKPDEYIAGFPSHPHRGFETVTYMLDGMMKHEDSQGNHGTLESGSVQWMTAGSGIIHSEMPMQQNGLMRGFQLWVNLPADKKMMKPRYQDIAPEKIPVIEIGNSSFVKLLAGKSGETEGPGKDIVTSPLYADISLAAGMEYEIAVTPGHTCLAYVFEGAMDFGAGSVQKSHLVEFSDGTSVAIKSQQGGRCILLAAMPLGEEIFRHGPFVMTTREEIMTAISEFNRGTFLRD